jgi:hypothetical protein
MKSKMMDGQASSMHGRRRRRRRRMIIIIINWTLER